MVHPDKVREEAKKRENENSRFRSYLKGHADEKKLDEQFLRLHKELFAEYEFIGRVRYVPSRKFDLLLGEP